jgi:hypothetical protein
MDSKTERQLRQKHGSMPHALYLSQLQNTKYFKDIMARSDRYRKTLDKLREDEYWTVNK